MFRLSTVYDTGGKIDFGHKPQETRERNHEGKSIDYGQNQKRQVDDKKIEDIFIHFTTNVF